jgi:outer membrane protein assembly factor BamB
MRLPRLPRENRGTWITALALGLVAIVVAVAAVYEITKQKPVSNSNVPINTTASPATKVVSKKGAKHFLWPIYGLNDARTRVFEGPADLKPPFRTAWKLSGNAPLEFPPDVYGNVMYFMDDHASVNKVNLKTGQRLWRKDVGVWSAASPALDPKAHLLFVPVLSKTQDSPGNGQFVAMNMKSGKVVWADPLPSGSESSPLVWHGIVYFGDSGGTVHAVNALTGKQVWDFPTSGPEKGGPTLSHGILYFGNYAGQLFAVNAKTGKQVWQASPGGTVYASPTVAYGRVYVGSTNGFMYSYSATTGALGWSIDTGGYVYSSAAADTARGIGATIYFGSYSGTAYAVNAATGHVDWSENLGGDHPSISGAASIVNRVVYFSGVYHGLTKGYDISTGRQVFSYPDGAYTSTIATPRAVYLMGHYTLYELLPKRQRR